MRGYWTGSNDLTARSILDSVVTSTLSTLDPDRLAPDAANPAVSSVMRDEVVFCLPSTPIDAVAKLLFDNDLREIAVLLDRRPVGYVCVEDIIGLVHDAKVVLSGSDFAARPPSTEAQAHHILRTPMLTVDEHQRLGEVASVMKQNQRRTALVMHEDETPVGMLTARELAAFLIAPRSANG